MKFTSIPEAYSSFNSPLVYEFESEQEAKDLLVEITDLATNEVIGRKKLYAATAGSIDIAPYLRRRAIATLPDKQRMVFNMKYFNEMKYEEISEVLGTSVGALKASFHIAVKKIEEYFNKID